MSEKLVGKKIRHITKDGIETDAIVVMVDFKKGITVDTLEPEKLKEAGYSMSEDDHVICLNAKDGYSGGTYKEHFQGIIAQIQNGIYDVSQSTQISTAFSSLSDCAFQ